LFYLLSIKDQQLPISQGYQSVPRSNELTQDNGYQIGNLNLK